MLSSGEEFLTVAEVAAILKVKPTDGQKLARVGSASRTLHVGRRMRIRRSDFEQFLEQGRTGASREPEQSSAHAFWEGELPPAPVERREHE